MDSLSTYVFDTIPGQGPPTGAIVGCLQQITAFTLMLVTKHLMSAIGPGMVCTVLAIYNSI
jgi:hypothetical protein